MNINDLYKKSLADDKTAENELFEVLTARFRLFTRQKVLNSQDIEEIVQNALTAIWENYKAVDFEVSFAAWAQRIVANKITDYYRTKRREKDRFREISENDVLVGERSPDPVFKKILMDCLKKVNAVNKRHARILILRYQGFDIGEICDRLNLTRNNSYSVLSRARTMLEICLEKGDIR